MVLVFIVNLLYLFSLDYPNQFLGVLFVGALDYFPDDVHHLGCTAAFLFQVLDDALAFDEDDSECHDYAGVRNVIPGEEKAENVYQDTEHHDTQVVDDLADGLSQGMASYAFPVCTCRIHTSPHVQKSRGNHKNTADKDYRQSPAHILTQIRFYHLH